MTLTEEKRENLHIFAHSVLENGGFYPKEADDDLNASNVRVIKAMEKEFGEAWLVKINLYNGDRSPIIKAVTEGHGYNCYNFCCSMIIPRYDAKLAELILARMDAPYTGTQPDGLRYVEIERQARSSGAITLIWS